jgi:hypothetical protein
LIKFRKKERGILLTVTKEHIDLTYRCGAILAHAYPQAFKGYNRHIRGVNLMFQHLSTLHGILLLGGMAAQPGTSLLGGRGGAD